MGPDDEACVSVGRGVGLGVGDTEHAVAYATSISKVQVRDTFLFNRALRLGIRPGLRAPHSLPGRLPLAPSQRMQFPRRGGKSRQ